MKETLITFETAKLAKEKGFEENVYNWYRALDKSKTIFGQNYKRGGLVPPISCGCGLYPAPTQSLLQKWLREEHNIIISIIPFKDYAADINDDYVFQYRLHYKNIYGTRTTYEQALEEGLKEALKLI